MTSGHVVEQSIPSQTVYLRAMDLFRDLTPEQIQAIHAVTPMRECERGTMFYRAGDPGERLFLLKQGRVILYRITQEGEKLVVGVIEKGAIFGEMAIAGQTMEECFAEAFEDSLVCTITREQMEDLLEEYPSIARRLLETLGNRVLHLEERLEQLAYGNVRQRLARFLLAQAGHAPDGCHVSGFTHDQIGAMVGATRQTISLELGALASEGLVSVGRRRVHLRSVGALKSLAGTFGSSESASGQPC